MFINFINTDIPFEEYQLTQDKIDALKFRLLLSEGYLNAYELDERGDLGQCYNVFLLSSNEKLLFLIVGNLHAVENDYPLLRLVDVSDGTPHSCSDEELIKFLSDVHEQHPDKPITKGYVSIDNELDAEIIIQKLDDELDYVIRARRHVPQEPVQESAISHYETYDEPSRRIVDLELSSSENAELEHMRKIILRKIYNYDCQTTEQ